MSLIFVRLSGGQISLQLLHFSCQGVAVGILGVNLTSPPITTPRPQFTTAFSPIPSFLTPGSTASAGLLLSSGNSLTTGDNGTLSSDQAWPPAELPCLPRSPLCLTSHPPCHSPPRNLRSPLAAVSLSSVLPECVQLNTGSRGRCRPCLAGRPRRRELSRIPSPCASSWIPGSLPGEGGPCLCLRSPPSQPASLQGSEPCRRGVAVQG